MVKGSNLDFWAIRQGVVGVDGVVVGLEGDFVDFHGVYDVVDVFE